MNCWHHVKATINAYSSISCFLNKFYWFCFKGPLLSTGGLRWIVCSFVCCCCCFFGKNADDISKEKRIYNASRMSMAKKKKLRISTAKLHNWLKNFLWRLLWLSYHRKSLRDCVHWRRKTLTFQTFVRKYSLNEWNCLRGFFKFSYPERTTRNAKWGHI